MILDILQLITSDRCDIVAVDFSALCPFCDEKLPAEPSATLRQLLQDAVARAYPEPRVDNPYGLRSTKLEDLIVVCRRHGVESDVIPRARREGWPLQVDWNHFKSRVISRRAFLKPLVDGVDEARDGCIFWTRLTAQINAGGSRVLNPKEQALAFRGHQAG